MLAISHRHLRQADLVCINEESQQKTVDSTFTLQQNAVWDHKLNHEELVKQAQASPPPAEWYVEEFTR